MPVFNVNGVSCIRIHVIMGNTRYEVAKPINLRDQRDSRSTMRYFTPYQKMTPPGQPKHRLDNTGLSAQNGQTNWEFCANQKPTWPTQKRKQQYSRFHVIQVPSLSKTDDPSEQQIV